MKGGRWAPKESNGKAKVGSSGGILGEVVAGKTRLTPYIAQKSAAVRHGGQSNPRAP